MANGKIVAEYATPHPPHLVYGESDLQRLNGPSPSSACAGWC